MSKKEITIKYNGESPNLCSGTLLVRVDGKKWEFPAYCLSSGGCVSFDDEWNEDVTEGPWDVTDWPVGFPDEIKQKVVDKLNDEIEWGCCGGCV